MEIDLNNHKFVIPTKQLTNPSQVPVWEKSKAYSELVGFILLLNEAVKNKKVNDDYPVSDAIQSVLDLIATLEEWIRAIPPIDQPQRFGNKAFRTFFNRLKEEASALVSEILPESHQAAVPEISVYLVESVGNDTRIDYGTGHELAFVAFLCCLCQLDVLKEPDYPAIVLRVFERYLNLVRHLQLTYCMEPAGSHGVWSLDDYQFLPFLWGSSQFIDHNRIKPKSFPEPDIYESFYKDYLFLSAIKFINKVKTGPFSEHSNQLWGISGVATWSKVNSGLIKMYRVEVLSKYPIVQHFLFGSLLTLEPSDNPVPPVSSPPGSAASSARPSPVLGAMPMAGVMPPGMGRMPPPMSGVMPGRMPPSGAGRMPPSVPGATGGGVPVDDVMPARLPRTSTPPQITHSRSSTSQSTSESSQKLSS